jgi:hypothetical protein
MAEPKRTKTHRRVIRFPEVKGKVVEMVEIDPDVEAITIIFEDKTALSFDLGPTLAIFPELSDWKTGNSRRIKRWPPLHAKPAMVSW